MNDAQPTPESRSAGQALASDRPARTPRVLIVGDLGVAEAVRVALVGRGLSAVSATWRSLLRTGTAVVPVRVLASVDVGLLISDLDTDARVQSAQQVLGGVPLPWLALSGAPRGPLWGAMLRYDVRVVRDSSTGLADLVDLLCDLEGGTADPAGPERAELVAAWDELWRERVDLADRMRSLSPREWDVLRLLYRGEPVTRIAGRFGVANSTVRSQVKSMLRKLGVRSQLGAVAAYGMLRSSQCANGREPQGRPIEPREQPVPAGADLASDSTSPGGAPPAGR